MHLNRRHELMKQTPLAPYYAQISTPFHSGDGNREAASAGTLHKISDLALACFNRLLKPLFPSDKMQDPSPIQECDPYLLGLLQYLQGRKRD